MKNRILTYRKYIDSLLQSDKDCDWKYIKQEHLTQVAFFQHERLVHLIVTITFAILELLTVCAYVIVGAIDSALSMPLLVLAIAILILLVPYIKHYYLLENEVQKMYKQYDRICEKERKLCKFNAGNIYKKGDIVVDFDRYKISRNGDELNISTNEFDIVRILIENKGRVVRRDAIYEKIWDIHGNFVEYNTLTVAMSRIKAKLGTYGEKHQQYIETIRNVGYRWID